MDDHASTDCGLTRRVFVQRAGLLTAGALLAPAVSFGMGRRDPENRPALPPLPYPYDALEVAIDEATMRIHHGKHHRGYVKRLQTALVAADLLGEGLDTILAELRRVKDAGLREAIRNHGGGHLNHTLFWNSMSPDGGGEPPADLSGALADSFGSLGRFREQFASAAGGVFGSGWAWLILDEGKRLRITTTPNQDNPIMREEVEATGTPLLGIDVWEHAYYLRYQNQRGQYVSNWWRVVDWGEVERRWRAAR